MRSRHAYAHSALLARVGSRSLGLAGGCGARPRSTPAGPAAAAAATPPAAAAGASRPPPAPAAAGAAGTDAQQPPRIRTGINYVRVDVIVTDKKRQAGPRPEAGRLRRRRRRQAAEDRRVRRRQDRRAATEIDGRSAARDPERLRRGARGAARPDVRLFVHSARRLPRAPRQRHGGAQAAHRLHPEPARAAGHGRDHVSADAGHRPALHPRSRRDSSRAIEQFEGRKFDYDAAQRVRGAVRQLSGRRRSRGSATTSRWARSRARRSRWAGCAKGASRSSSSAKGFTSHAAAAAAAIRSRRMPGVGNPYRGNAGAPQAIATTAATSSTRPT